MKSYSRASPETIKAIERLDKRISKLVSEREALIMQRAREDGFKPCDDCMNGYCTMNCTSAPIYMQVLFP